MIWILGVFFLGACSGWILLQCKQTKLLSLIGKGIIPLVCLLLLCMGLSVAANKKDVVARLAWSSLSAFILAVGGILGSAFVCSKGERFFQIGKSQGEKKVENEITVVHPSGPKTTLLFAICLVAGGIGGFVFPLLQGTWIESLTPYVLYGLLGSVGATIGGDRSTIQSLHSVQPVFFLFPLGSALGTLVVTGLLGALLPRISWAEGMAVGAGFGYYSLSSVLISRIVGPDLGVTALLANLCREAGTLLFGSFLMKKFGALGPIASGGATTMDTTLPVIILTSGKEYALLALINGVVLTLMVPSLISMIFYFHGLL